MGAHSYGLCTDWRRLTGLGCPVPVSVLVDVLVSVHQLVQSTGVWVPEPGRSALSGAESAGLGTQNWLVCTDYYCPSGKRPGRKAARLRAHIAECKVGGFGCSHLVSLHQSVQSRQVRVAGWADWGIAKRGWGAGQQVRGTVCLEFKARKTRQTVPLRGW